MSTTTSAPVSAKKAGRPVVSGSKRQQRLATQAALRAAGSPIKRGRRPNPDSKRQQSLSAKNN
jgi:hypothetical protein